MFAPLPLGAVVGGIGREKDGSGLLELEQKRHVPGRVAGRLQQPNRSVTEQIQLTLDKLPAQITTVVILADVSRGDRVLGRAGGLELAGVHDDRGVREVTERAGVIDVQVGLHHVANRLRLHPEPPSRCALIRTAVRRSGRTAILLRWPIATCWVESSSPADLTRSPAFTAMGAVARVPRTLAVTRSVRWSRARSSSISGKSATTS